jgi:Peptidase A4 family
MSASVSVSGSTYTITLTDNTRGWTQTENEAGSGLSDSSAEIVTEAPSTESGPLPLADFGTVNYANSTVNGESMDSLSPTAIEMVGVSGDQLDSTSGMDSSGDFSNTWMAES